MRKPVLENTVYFAVTDSTDLSKEVRRLTRKALPLRGIMTFIGDVSDESYLINNEENGKPFLTDIPDIHISLSHTKGAVAVAFSENPVGIDIEHPRQVSSKVVGRYFTEVERKYAVDDERRLEIWTRKEAYLKRGGRLERPAGETETLENAEITTQKIGQFTLSFCGTPTGFTLNEVVL